ncbi:MAG: 50S ribosomal protein L4 [Verrucomicrobia bacterium]|jgi:large subunit ribosomal protein L4|nr:50S ribosomal protein L4 [Verrucomicrobiota bacterium]
MSSKTLSLADAKAANIQLLDDPTKGGQAVHDLIVAYQANRRSGSANSKTRGEVSGNTKKMYRQKGTGNARHGTSKAPIFVGGGVVFGPKPRDYSKTVPKKVRKLALKRVLGELIAEEAIHVVETFTVADGKTKTFVAQIEAITDAVKVLVISKEFDDKTLLAHRNVPGAECIPAHQVSIEELLYNDVIIITQDALDILAARTA